MPVTIDRKLNLVVPVETQDGKTYYVHIAPLSRQVFQQNFRILTLTFDGCYSLGMAGPRQAALVLQELATNSGTDISSLQAEMRRGANVLVPTAQGYDVCPWEEAVARNLFDEDDLAEVEGAITFFTVASAVHRRKELKTTIDLLRGLWSAQESSSTPMAFANSLKTSTAPAPSASSTEPLAPSQPQVPY